MKEQRSSGGRSTHPTTASLCLCALAHSAYPVTRVAVHRKRDSERDRATERERGWDIGREWDRVKEGQRERRRNGGERGKVGKWKM